VGRFVSAGGGIATLTGQVPIIGGSIAIAYPVAEALVSEWEEKMVKSNESK
jgi:hypothetical protein